MAHVHDGGSASDEFAIRLIVSPPVLRIWLAGELDSASTTGLKHIVDPGPSVGTVIVDLADLTFCDIRGLRALTEFRAEQMHRNRHFAFVHTQSKMQRLMELAGVSRRVT